MTSVVTLTYRLVLSLVGVIAGYPGLVGAFVLLPSPPSPPPPPVVPTVLSGLVEHVAAAMLSGNVSAALQAVTSSPDQTGTPGYPDAARS